MRKIRMSPFCVGLFGGITMAAIFVAALCLIFGKPIPFEIIGISSVVTAVFSVTSVYIVGILDKKALIKDE